MSQTFALERGSLCTVLWSVDAGELRVRFGDEVLTPRDLARINDEAARLIEARQAAAAPLPPRKPR